ncbi:GGDEF domain-containing protein [Levilactobacillus wangkuiensis]|uniref:GGDEF domain-containing protein n=1 Tax=Levilactobacillus wangkuiensis TaxID=2799566 RepID=UPI0019416694|nr:GGDEF domain-containing protein [Levilactobacillus wangkuiensis]
MTWSHWQVPPFITSVFFVLGVFTLYWVSYNWIASWARNHCLKISEESINMWYGIAYMVAFAFGIQTFVVGQTNSWEFMNFQLIAVIFCAYFLNIHLPYYWFFPILLAYMTFNGSLGYWQSWGHAATMMTFFITLNVIRVRYHNHKMAPVLYMAVGIPFGGLLWLWMKLKFDFTWMTFWEEWAYLIIFEVLLYIYVSMLSHDVELKLRLAKFASHDALTKTENFAAYTDAIQYLFDEHQNSRRPLAMMMFDIDHFKHINDTYGHSAGDAVLQQVTDAVQTVLAANDSTVKLYRTGGEEFNILFPGYDLAETEHIVKQIFTAVNHLEIHSAQTIIHVTISVGVSAVSEDDQSPIEFYNRVDKNLYHSKRNGRMQVTVA